MLTLKVELLDPAATLPTRGTPGSAGLDLYSLEHFRLFGGGHVGLIKTGLKLEIPPGYEGQIRPRSGLALRHGVTVLNAPGTIDSDYRGPVNVLLINHGQGPIDILPGDRIAQLVIAKVEAVEVAVALAPLTETSRGTGGFGSTGK